MCRMPCGVCWPKNHKGPRWNRARAPGLCLKWCTRPSVCRVTRSSLMRCSATESEGLELISLLALLLAVSKTKSFRDRVTRETARAARDIADQWKYASGEHIGLHTQNVERDDNIAAKCGVGRVVGGYRCKDRLRWACGNIWAYEWQNFSLMKLKNNLHKYASKFFRT